MTPKEILAIDAQRNHPPGTTVGELITDINDVLRTGGDIIQQGNTLIVYRAVEPGVVEHYSFSAEPLESVLEANIAFWKMMKKAGASTVRTAYEDPQIKTLLDLADLSFEISVEEQDGDYVVEVGLQ
jgi:hypothetical protein